MEDAERLIQLIRTNPGAGLVILVVTLTFAGLLRSAQVAAEELTKRWLEPNESAKNSKDSVNPPQTKVPLGESKIFKANKSLRRLWERPSTAASALGILASLVVAFIAASISLTSFEGEFTDGQACQGSRLFGIEFGACSTPENSFRDIEGF
ncbi:hypothetical protein [Pontivivens ytuae]|uniref:Uncharacterized protein n=1 Tax=Pontivivens ytuae TaxID=2789856 RepID=A0A7S9LU11_9RHOB|nr:hypothetical protein [Pontivivens ytuae]QPH54735.1 hypothetical protein I0K15_02855 [Pontivivens ytuae]